MIESMKRAEAVEIIKRVHDDSLFSVRTALEELVPELRNKDEIIRNRLLAYFEGFKSENKRVGWEGLDVGDIINWLKKR